MMVKLVGLKCTSAMARSTKTLCRRNVFRSRLSRSSAVAHGMVARVAKSCAQLRVEPGSSFPLPPPLPPHAESSVGSEGNSAGALATTGGTTHVLERKPCGRFPNCKSRLRSYSMSFVAYSSEQKSTARILTKFYRQILRCTLLRSRSAFIRLS